MHSSGPSGGFLSWTLFGLSVIVIVTALWAFVYWWKKNRHTRERFAFLGATTLISLVGLLVLQITNNASLVAILIEFFQVIVKAVGLADILGISTQTYKPKELSPFETMVFTFLIFGMGVWFYKVFGNWEGLKSKAQYDQEQTGIRPNVIGDIKLVLTLDKERRKLLTPYLRSSDTAESLLDGAKDNRAWHEQARQLWLLHRRQYVFDDDYDSTYKCWWGREKNTGAQVCLGCYQSMPPRTDIEALDSYMQQHVQTRDAILPREIILAIKNDVFLPTEEQRNGYTLQRTNQQTLLDNLVDFSDYFTDIIDRVERATLPDSELTLQNTYTPSNYKLSDGDVIVEGNLESFLMTWLHENTFRQLALLGEYGQGKSTISLMLSYKLIKLADGNPLTRVPILIELRGKSPRSLTPEELLATWAYRYRIDVQALLQLLMAGRLLLIFEGFDEIDLTGDTDSRLNHFRTLWKLCYPQSKLLVTGRPNFFLDDTERKRALGINTPNAARPYCEAVSLSPFTIAQMEISLRSIEAQTKLEIIELAKKDTKFSEIVTRPSLLFIVSTLWKRENLSEKRGEISSALIMELFIRHSYRRQGAKQAERNFMALNTAERAYFMRGIAAHMAVNGLPNQISTGALDHLISRLVDAIPDEVSRSVGAIENETRHPLKITHQDRFDWEHSRAESLEHIKTDVRACGILVTDFSKDGTFKFAHKSFMEFLQAEVVSHLYVSDTSIRRSALSIVNSLGLRVAHLQDSMEALVFLAELMLQHVKSHGSVKEDRVASLLFNIFILKNLNHDSFAFRIQKSSLQSLLNTLNLLPSFVRRRTLENIEPNFILAYSSGIFFIMIISVVFAGLGQMITHEIMPFVSFKDSFNSWLQPRLVSVSIGVLLTTIFLSYWLSLTRDIFRDLSNSLKLWLVVCISFGVSRETLDRYIGRRVVEDLKMKT
jgi:hypothetical protein